MRRVVLRDLAAIAAIEGQFREWDRLFKDEREELEKEIDSVSFELFGITERETSYWELPPELFQATTPKEWERHFEFLEWEFEVEQAFWKAFRVDVTSDDGSPLECLEVFGRQLVCALKRIHPRATLTFMGGAQSEEQVRAAAEAWLRRLLDE